MWIFAWIFACSLLIGFQSDAAVLTLDVTGAISDFGDDSAILDGSISLGTPFHMHVVYDEAESPYFVQGHESDWIFTVPPGQISLSVGNYSVAAGSVSDDPTLPIGFGVYLFDDVAGGNDSYAISASGPVSGGAGAVFATFGLLLYDSNGTALGVPGLSGVPFSLEPWDVAHSVELVLSDSNQPGSREATMHGQIQQLQQLNPQGVPEPASGVLSAAVLAALGFAARARR